MKQHLMKPLKMLEKSQELIDSKGVIMLENVYRGEVFVDHTKDWQFTDKSTEIGYIYIMAIFLIWTMM